MKYLRLLLLSGMVLLACSVNDKPMGTYVKITIGSRTFKALLYENKSAEAFKALLPLTLPMSELNQNEKFAPLSSSLPTNTEKIGTIREGDLMLWGANTLVLFYQTFQTSYPYTKIGRIENPAGLAAAVGSGSVTVTFERDM